MTEKVSLLDYGAGNVRSLRNAIKALGYEVVDISTADEIMQAKAILFPGVGRYGQAMKAINERGWFDALQTYLKAGRPFFGICLGMQSLFEGSEEDPGVPGLGIIPGMATRFVTPSSEIQFESDGSVEMICRFLVLCAVLAVVSGFRALPSSGRMGK